MAEEADVRSESAQDQSAQDLADAGDGAPAQRVQPGTSLGNASASVVRGASEVIEPSLDGAETSGSRAEGGMAEAETSIESVSRIEVAESTRGEESMVEGIEAAESARGEESIVEGIEVEEESMAQVQPSFEVVEGSEAAESARSHRALVEEIEGSEAAESARSQRALAEETSLEMLEGPGDPRPISVSSSKGATGASLSSLGMKLDVTLVLNSIEEDGKAQQEAFPLFSLVSTNPAKAPNAEVPWSQLLALSLSPDHEPPVLTVGRHKDCNVKLDDPRVSVHHFNIVARKKYAEGAVEAELGSIMYDCYLNDSSSNGTMVNGKIVGRGQSCQLHGGDEICVLPATTVGAEHTISWIFRNTTEVLATPRAAVEAPEIKLVDHVTCPICMLVMYRCVALSPCFHNFCSCCYSDWMARSSECPVCRQPPNAVLKNHAMDEVIDAVLEVCPDKRRSEEEMREMDNRDRLQFGGGKMMHNFDAPEDPAERGRASEGTPPGASNAPASDTATAANGGAAGATSNAVAVPESTERRRSRRAIQNCVVQ